MNNPIPLNARTLGDMAPSAVLRQQYEREREPILLSYWFIVLRRKFVIIPILIAALVMGLVVTLLTTPRYTATARVEISKTPTNLANIGSQDQENDKLSELTFYETQYGLLRARSLAERVARSLRLVDDKTFYEAFDLSRGSSGAVEGRLTEQERQTEFVKVVNVLLGNQKVAPVRDSSLVDIHFEAPDPEIAARVANAWVEQFIQANMDQRFSATAGARSFLEQRLDQLRRRLEQSERDLVNYSSASQIVTLGTSVDADGKTHSERTLTGEYLESFSSALAQATAERIAAESRLGKGEAATSTGQSERSGGLTLLRQQRAEVAADYAKMMVQFEPSYPPAAALKSKMDTLDRAIASESSRVAKNVATEYQEALGREQQLKSVVDNLRVQLNREQQRGIQANIYQREVDTNRELYNALLQRYKEIGVAGVGANSVLPVDRAKAPEAPSSPNVLLNMLVALMLGAIVSGGVTFALEQIDETVKNPGDLARAVNQSFLGAIPNDDKDDPLTLLGDPKSAVAEAYFSALTNLRFSTEHGLPRTLIVTSTRAAEGKSTSATALARSIGRTGGTVVLIDADMRSPSLHTFFGMNHDLGLSNFLTGDQNIDSLLNDTDYPGVRLMTSGPQPPNTAELLSGSKMGELIAILSKQYDHVIIDAPPMLGLADSPLISQQVEGVVFIVSASGPSVRLVRSALERLHTVNAHIFGVMLTKFRSTSNHYGYGYGYDYGYGKS